MKYILETSEAWHQMHDASCETVKRYSEIDADVLFIANPSGSISGVMNLEAGEKYAAVIIGRRLKSEGQVDEDVKVLIHKTIRAHNSYQILYTAIPLSEWTKLMTWSESQKYHCMIVPLLQLIMESLPDKKGHIVARSNAILHYIAISEYKISYLSTAAFSESYDDLLRATNSLGSRVRVNLNLESKEDNLVNLMYWTSLLVSTEAEEKEKKLKSIFDEIVDSKGKIIEYEKFRTKNNEINSPLVKICKKPKGTWFANGKLDKLKFYLSTISGNMIAITMILTMLAFFQSAWWIWETSKVYKKIETENNKLKNISSRMNELKKEEVKQPVNIELVKLTATIERYRSGIDIPSLLTMLKDSKPEDVRVLRVYGESASTDKRQKESIDNIFIEVSSGLEGEQRPMVGFFENIRNSGYEVIPIDGRDSNINSNSNRYTYRLRKIPITKL